MKFPRQQFRPVPRNSTDFGIVWAPHWRRFVLRLSPATGWQQRKEPGSFPTGCRSTRMRTETGHVRGTLSRLRVLGSPCFGSDQHRNPTALRPLCLQCLTRIHTHARARVHAHTHTDTHRHTQVNSGPNANRGDLSGADSVRFDGWFTTSCDWLMDGWAG